jgi:DNA polymerase
MTRRLCLDIESTSECDLAKSGVAAYWQHPSTVLICASWRVNQGPVGTWRPGEPLPPFANGYVHNGTWRVVAHNFLFEYWAWREHLGPKYGWGPVPPSLRLWDCTMARALYWGLPAGLIDLAYALNLPHQIDPAKKSRIRRMARPRGHDKVTGAPIWWHDTDPAKLQELLDDCENDVLTECAADDILPPLPGREREIFLIDAEINLRGINLDLPLVDKLLTLTNSEGARLNAEMAQLTGKRVTTCNQGAKIISEMTSLGFTIPDLTKASVAAQLGHIEAMLQTYTSSPSNMWCDYEKARDILLTRQEAAKASTAKLAAMVKGASPDGRARGLFQYCGAGRTQRWAARRIQPQNVPRGVVKGLASLFNLVEKGYVQASVLATLLPCTVMDAISSMLRGCLISSVGYSLVSADLSQIEARLLAWYSGQADVLAIFVSGEDVYLWTANRVGSTNRQLGKVLVLACGFGMGPEKFRETALTYGVVLSLAEATAYVLAWRKLNSKSVQFWWDCDRAFRNVAVAGHGYSETVGFVTFRKTSKAVRIVMPSGSELTYHQVQLKHNPDTGRDDITFMGVEPKTKKWSEQRTYSGKIVENIVQKTDRDILAETMLTLRKIAAKPYPPAWAENTLRLLGNMHDELLGEAPDQVAQDALVLVLGIMRAGVSWAPGLPVGAEGWVGKRYRK